MSVSYFIYTFPATKFSELIKNKKEGYSQITDLLTRSKVKDKQIMGFLSGEVRAAMKDGFLDINKLDWSVRSFIGTVAEYTEKVDDYRSWIKGDEVKFLARNRNKKPYTRPSEILLEAVEDAINAQRRKTGYNKLYVLMDLTDEEGKEIKFKELECYEMSYKRNGKIGMKIFWNEQNYELYDKINRLKKKEKEWKKLKKWFFNRKAWLKERGIDDNTFKVIVKLRNLIASKVLRGTLFHCYIFDSWIGDSEGVLDKLREYGDKLTGEI